MKKYLIGVSGGPDSMALLYMYKNQISLVCHVNYQKRLTSGDDCKIVEDYCNKNHIKFASLNVSKNIYAKYLKINHNFQSIARSIRYDFFKKCAGQNKLNDVLIAHQKDDFLETSIMQLKRNHIALHFGIEQHSEWYGLKIYRPLLFNYWKKDLTKYCVKHHINYKEDETNKMDIYERNRIRQMLGQWSNKKKEMLFKKVISFNTRHLKKYKKIIPLFFEWSSQQYGIPFFQKQDNLMKYFLLLEFLKSNNVGRISNNKIILILKFIYSNIPNKKLRLSSKLFLMKKNGFLTLQK